MIRTQVTAYGKRTWWQRFLRALGTKLIILSSEPGRQSIPVPGGWLFVAGADNFYLPCTEEPGKVA